MLRLLETLRKQTVKSLDRDRKAELGQFFTPAPIAQFMASMFEERELMQTHLLDPGAGLGALSIAFFEVRHSSYDYQNRGRK